jgi:hypothetical protein
LNDSRQNPAKVPAGGASLQLEGRLALAFLGGLLAIGPPDPVKASVP